MSEPSIAVPGDPNAGSMMMMEYDANKKSAGIAYVLWFFLGLLGAHRFYLSRRGTGAAILILTIVSILLMVVVIGGLLLVIPAIWVFVDAFLIPGMARAYNNRLIERLKISRLRF